MQIRQRVQSIRNLVENDTQKFVFIKKAISIDIYYTMSSFSGLVYVSSRHINRCQPLILDVFRSPSHAHY
jgi:hypothetical protein